ncbi:TIGR04222 domain-containing membrane protein [Allokutzneria sp. NRRL B-24872]|uniref:TIGR04222 domain-containing membrane protein n=1 Tax=Allokutzneria sp. NRRL B-24872 TaxID=1137961 RepID=UPI000A39808C|nr:TIGR04222 domain-containing membrane protein [Allokutzneria sp. NRRL B-24872]
MSTVFLVAYGTSVVGLALLTVWMRRSALVKSTVDTSVTELTWRDVAYLRGGQHRVAEAAIARLLHDGQLRTTRLGGLVRTENALAENEIEEAVLEAAPLSVAVTVSALTTRVVGHDAMHLVADRLIANGLAISEQDRTKVRRAALPLFALTALGVVAVLLQPWLLVVSIPLAALPIAVFAFACRPLGTATTGGARLAEEAGSALPHPAAGPVALQGFQHFPDETLRLYAQELRPARVPHVPDRPKGRRTGSGRDTHTCSTGHGGGSYNACTGGGGGY